MASIDEVIATHKDDGFQFVRGTVEGHPPSFVLTHENWLNTKDPGGGHIRALAIRTGTKIGIQYLSAITFATSNLTHQHAVLSLLHSDSPHRFAYQLGFGFYVRVFVLTPEPLKTSAHIVHIGRAVVTAFINGTCDFVPVWPTEQLLIGVYNKQECACTNLFDEIMDSYGHAPFLKRFTTDTEITELDCPMMPRTFFTRAQADEIATDLMQLPPIAIDHFSTWVLLIRSIGALLGYSEASVKLATAITLRGHNYNEGNLHRFLLCEQLYIGATDKYYGWGTLKLIPYSPRAEVISIFETPHRYWSFSNSLTYEDFHKEYLQDTYNTQKEFLNAIKPIIGRFVIKVYDTIFVNIDGKVSETFKESEVKIADQHYSLKYISEIDGGIPSYSTFVDDPFYECDSEFNQFVDHRHTLPCPAASCEHLIHYIESELAEGDAAIIAKLYDFLLGVADLRPIMQLLYFRTHLTSLPFKEIVEQIAPIVHVEDTDDPFTQSVICITKPMTLTGVLGQLVSNKIPITGKGFMHRNRTNVLGVGSAYHRAAEWCSYIETEEEGSKELWDEITPAAVHTLIQYARVWPTSLYGTIANTIKWSKKWPRNPGRVTKHSRSLEFEIDLFATGVKILAMQKTTWADRLTLLSRDRAQSGPAIYHQYERWAAETEHIPLSLIEFLDGMNGHAHIRRVNRKYLIASLFT